MTIRKYLHSCVLFEKNGEKLLIDPGSFSFFDKQISPVDIGAVDAILITHGHPDHYYPDALKYFAESGCKSIIAPSDICELLEKEGLPNRSIESGEKEEVAGFNVLTIEARHGSLPTQIPKNFAYLIDDKFLHPGDSLEVNIPRGVNVEVLFLPTFAPWEKTIESLDCAKRIKPKIVVPIHDWFIKDQPLQRFYDLMYKPTLENFGIKFSDLKPGDKLDV